MPDVTLPTNRARNEQGAQWNETYRRYIPAGWDVESQGLPPENYVPAGWTPSEPVKVTPVQPTEDDEEAAPEQEEAAPEEEKDDAKANYEKRQKAAQEDAARRMAEQASESPEDEIPMPPIRYAPASEDTGWGTKALSVPKPILLTSPTDIGTEATAASPFGKAFHSPATQVVDRTEPLGLIGRQSVVDAEAFKGRIENNRLRRMVSERKWADRRRGYGPKTRGNPLAFEHDSMSASLLKGND